MDEWTDTLCSSFTPQTTVERSVAVSQGSTGRATFAPIKVAPTVCVFAVVPPSDIRVVVEANGYASFCAAIVAQTHRTVADVVINVRMDAFSHQSVSVYVAMGTS